MRPADIGVVVVSHNSASTLEDCIGRLLAAEGVADVVVVDNGSADASLAVLERLQAGEPRLRVVANAGNPGFAVACNQGASRLETAWLALVNPDLMVQGSSLRQLRDLAEALPEPALVGAELVDAHGVRDVAARRRDPSLRLMLSGLGRRGSVAVPRDSTRALQDVDAVSGALMLMPRMLYLGLGGFDEGYRLHAEDLDLCRRVRAGGGRVLVANEVVVTHLRGVSSRRRPVWVEWQKHRGMWRYFRKFEGGDAGMLVHALAFAAIWSHWLLAAPRAWLSARRTPATP